MKDKGNSKSLGMFDLVSMGVGSIIGAGIFSMLGIGITYSGRGIVIAMLLAMLLTFIQFIRPFVFSAVFDLPGGTYDQTSLVFPPVLIGAGSLTTIISNFSRSVQGLAVASYLAMLFPVLVPYQRVIAFIVVTGVFALTIGGNKFISKFQNVMVICMYAALVLFIVYGIANYDSAAVASSEFLPQGGVGLLLATSMMSYTCSGALNIINLTKDTEDARKKVPKAIVLSCVIAALIYALIGFAATCCLPYSEISGQNLGDIAKMIMPTGMYVFVIIGGALFALLTTLVGAISATKWPIYASAKDGWLPQVFAKQTKTGYPWAVMLMMYLIAVIPIIGGFSLESIVSMILVPTAVSTIASVFCCWRVPEKYPKAWKENTLHMSPGMYRGLLLLSVVASTLISVFSLINQSAGMIIANLAMTAGLFVYAALRYRSGKVTIASREIYTE